jgi:3-(3-hydroxy-phenyl)propionate hydroxylase
MPDLDLDTTNGSRRVFMLLHQGRPVLLNFGEHKRINITPWGDRVQSVDASYEGRWELPVIGQVAAPAAALIRPDGYVAWVNGETQRALAEALTTWFGPTATA